MSAELSWVRIKWDDWHLEDTFSAQVKEVSTARTACGERLSEIYVNFERAGGSQVPRHQRCSKCQSVAQQHGGGW
jgi:hypothetical protein